MLRGELAPSPGGHPDHDRHRELTVGHVPQGRSGVHDLIQTEQAEVDCHDFDDRPQTAQCGADADTDEAELGDRGVADAVRPELLEHSFRHRVRPAVAADVLAEQHHPIVGPHRIGDGVVHRGAVVGFHETTPVPAGVITSRVRVSMLSSVPASA